MLPWEDRPLEIANLLNPAFCALLLRDAAYAYEKRASAGLPYPLAFLILPIVLHRQTREALPRTTATLLHPWLLDHSLLQMEVQVLSRRLLPYSREAVIFGLLHSALNVADDGSLESGMKSVRKVFDRHTEPDACRKAASFVGSWFGKVGDPALVLAMWGIMP
jgi:hypothetical protein